MVDGVQHSLMGRRSLSVQGLTPSFAASDPPDSARTHAKYRPFDSFRKRIRLSCQPAGGVFEALHYCQRPIVEMQSSIAEKMLRPQSKLALACPSDKIDRAIEH